jgi:hypothetical protein
MNRSEKLTYEDFKNVLTPQNLKALQVVYFALGFGIFIFTITLFFIYGNISGMVTSTEDSQILILSAIHFSLLIICFPLSKYLFKNISEGNWLSKFVFQNPGETENTTPVAPAKSFWDRLRNAHIIRLTLFEGVALFGLVICALAMFDGVLQTYAVYWVNLISSFVFGIVLVSTFPTIEKLETFFREYVQG